MLDDYALKLAAMVRPEFGEPAAPQLIWEEVMDYDGILPGKWNVSLEGALLAARGGDWPLCTYLAARCCRDSGSASLGVRDRHSADLMWVVGVAPLVAEVPEALRRLRVFSVGEVIDIFATVKSLRRYDLSEQEVLRVQKLLPDAVLGDDFTAISTDWPLVPTSLSKGKYHVLAYPLAGDESKVLLRPAQTPLVERQLLEVLGETLVSQCAKAGQWEIVELLLGEGVPCPDLSEEFADVCGTHNPIRRQWLHDLRFARSRNPSSLLHLAISTDGNRAFNAVRKAAVAAHVADQVREELLVVTANAGRWDLCQELLEEDVSSISVAALAELATLRSAPVALQNLVEERLQNELFVGTRAKSLREHFERQLAGEVFNSETVPSGFTEEDGILVAHDDNPDALRFLGRALRFGMDPLGDGAILAFVSITPDELETAREAVAPDSGQSILPVDLNGKAVELRDPRSLGGAWLAVSCPPRYLKTEQAVTGSPVISCDDQTRQQDARSWLRVPSGAFPAPYIPQVNLRICAVTPCCGSALARVPVHIDGRRMGTTSEFSELRLALAPGKHTITPLSGLGSEAVSIELGRGVESEEKFHVGGIFIYLLDVSEGGEESRYQVKVTTNQYQIPTDAKSFSGTVVVDQQPMRVTSSSSSAPSSIRPIFSLGSGVNCKELLRSLRVHPDGGHFQKDEEFPSWLLQQECAVQALHGCPGTLGVMTPRHSHEYGQADASEAGSPLRYSDRCMSARGPARGRMPTPRSNPRVSSCRATDGLAGWRFAVAPTHSHVQPRPPMRVKAPSNQRPRSSGRYRGRPSHVPTKCPQSWHRRTCEHNTASATTAAPEVNSARAWH